LMSDHKLCIRKYFDLEFDLKMNSLIDLCVNGLIGEKEKYESSLDIILGKIAEEDPSVLNYRLM
jgi:hypothetical protein